MKFALRISVAVFFAPAILGGLSVGAPAAAETLKESNVDARATVALRVKPAAAQALLPAPWTVSPLPKGPFKGANVLLVLIDRLLSQDAKGKPAGGGTYRMAVLVVPGKNPETGKGAPFIVRVYANHQGKGPYGNSVTATVRREAAVNGASLEPGAGGEAWTVRADDGGTLEFRMDYRRAVPKRMKRVVKPRSAADPGLYRIYRYEQLIDVVKSVPAGINRVPSYTLRGSGTGLDKLFDGTEEIVGIAVIPWYMRQTFMP